MDLCSHGNSLTLCSAKLLQNGGSRNISARELWREEAIGQKIKRGGKREEQRQRFCEANIFFEFYNIEISSPEILTTELDFLHFLYWIKFRVQFKKN